MLNELRCGLWVAEDQEVRNRIVYYPDASSIFDLMAKQPNRLVVSSRQTDGVPRVRENRPSGLGYLACHAIYLCDFFDRSNPGGVTINQYQVGEVGNQEWPILPPR